MMTVQQRQTLFISLGALFLIGVGIMVVYLYSLAGLKVITNNSNNTIYIRKIETLSSMKQISIEQKGNTVETRVSPGKYIITVKNGPISKSKTVNLNMADNQEIKLFIDNKTLYTNSEPTTSFGAGSISADKDTIRFINRNDADNELYSVAKSGLVSHLDKGVAYDYIKWADATFGIGIGKNKTTGVITVSVVDKDEVKHVKTPFKPNTYVSIAVAPNHNWYVSDGKNVYQGFSDGSFKLIYKTDKTVGVYSASNNAVIMMQTIPNKIREGTIISLHNDGTKYQIPGSAYELAWSPSGNRLVTSGDVTAIFDDKLNKLDTPPTGNFISPVWLNNSTILYSSNYTVYRYDMNTGEDTALKEYQSDSVGRPGQLALSSEKDYLYIAIQKNSSAANPSFKLTRIALNNQPTKQLPVISLDLMIPNNVKRCGLQYVNLEQFTIINTGPRPLGECMGVIQDYLASYNMTMQDISVKDLQ